ncbi:uncharacterized protein LOC122295939 isoform X2 [Carya illinoinensis]|uniref:uncharacterized protein LOC122295939 isoform X2 n=1 Tax=Carya illinoinensis TaxID=32201 RepID=UPI001C719779|nr:uncharacterized protein LOC122295939 isoform X2 [Carya illinoinensis]
MLVTEKSFIFNSVTSYPFLKTNGREVGITLASKRDLPKKSTTTQQENIFPLRVSNPVLARSVVAVLGLGFIDAGKNFNFQVQWRLVKDWSDIKGD